MSNSASERVNESENNAYHSTGATFTGNPRYTGPNEPIQENPGMITSDSLAAASLSSGGSFASNQENITASSQKSSGYSGSTTDTSGAEILAPTTDKASRDPDSMEEYRTPADEADRRSAAKQSGISSGEYDTSAGRPQGSMSSSDDTPNSYANAAGGRSGTSNYNNNDDDDENAGPRPHGKNIKDVTESGFEGSNQEAGVTTDMGGKDDPGRYAENSMIAGNQRGAADAGYPNATQGADAGRNQGGFENLSEETSS